MTLKTQLWLTLAAAIVLGQIAGAVVARVTTSEADRALAVARRAAPFIQRALEVTWTDPPARDALIDTLQSRLHRTVEVQAPDGRVVVRAGPIRCATWADSLVGPSEAPLGTIRVCADRAPRWPAQLSLFVSLGAGLWLLASLATARTTEATHGLDETVRRLAAGDFAARAPRTPGSPRELRRFAETLDELAERVGRHLDTQRQLLATVSHELRSPLARLRVLVELGAPNLESDIAKDLRRELHEMNTLVEALLDDARLSFLRANRVRRRLTPIVRDAVALVDTTIAVDADDDLEVEVDPALMQRAIALVVDNARRHGEPPIAVSVQRSENIAVVTVRDHGRGFATAAVGQIYREAFAPGIGSALAARIVGAHGGSVKAWNDDGAHVQIALPLAEPSPARALRPTPEPT